MRACLLGRPAIDPIAVTAMRLIPSNEWYPRRFDNFTAIGIMNLAL